MKGGIEIFYEHPKEGNLNMLALFSLFIVVGYSFFFFISAVRKNKEIATQYSKCIPMVVGMTSSLTIGLIISVWLPEMAKATVLSILISAVIAIFIGLPFKTNGLVEAQASSLMGSMMGAMLGIMLVPSEVTLMIISMDLIYLISIFAMMLLMHKKHSLKEALKNRPVPFYLTFLLSIAIICASGIHQEAKNSIHPIEENTPQVEHHH